MKILKMFITYFSVNFDLMAAKSNQIVNHPECRYKPCFENKIESTLFEISRSQDYYFWQMYIN